MLSHETECLEMDGGMLLSGRYLLFTLTITGDAHGQTARDDNDESAINRETATERPEAKCNECHYGPANAIHKKEVMATTSKIYHHWNFPPIAINFRE